MYQCRGGLIMKGAKVRQSLDRSMVAAKSNRPDYLSKIMKYYHLANHEYEFLVD